VIDLSRGRPVERDAQLRDWAAILVGDFLALLAEVSITMLAAVGRLRVMQRAKSGVS